MQIEVFYTPPRVCALSACCIYIFALAATRCIHIKLLRAFDGARALLFYINENEELTALQMPFIHSYGWMRDQFDAKFMLRACVHGVMGPKVTPENSH